MERRWGDGGDGDGLGKVGGRVVGRVGWLGFTGPHEGERGGTSGFERARRRQRETAGRRGEEQGDRVRERAQRGRELSRFEVGGAG